MFKGRFGTKWSWEGPQRLKNLYFVYLMELRALVKAAPYLQKELFYTGNEQEDQETRQMIEGLMDVAKEFKDSFDETEMFTVSYLELKIESSFWGNSIDIGFRELILMLVPSEKNSDNIS